MFKPNISISCKFLLAAFLCLGTAQAQMTLTGAGGTKPRAATLTCSYTPITTGTQGVFYTGATPSASGGTPPYSFSDTGTALPAALTTNTSTGVISGTPSGSGTTSGIQLGVADSASHTANCGSAFNLVISPGSSFALTFESSQTSNNSSATTIDYGTMTFGSGSTRIIVGIIYANNFGGPNNTVTGIASCNGATFSQISGAAVNNGSTTVAADMWISSGSPTGTSCDIQVTWSAANGGRSSVALYNLVTTTPTVSAVKNANLNFGNPITLGSALVVPSGGGAIALTGGQNGTAISSFPNAAQDAVQTNNQYYYHTTATGSLTLSATYAGNDGLILTSAAWGP